MRKDVIERNTNCWTDAVGCWPIGRTCSSNNCLTRKRFTNTSCATRLIRTLSPYERERTFINVLESIFFSYHFVLVLGKVTKCRRRNANFNLKEEEKKYIQSTCLVIRSFGKEAKQAHKQAFFFPRFT